jgi:hypothetical protein
VDSVIRTQLKKKRQRNSLHYALTTYNFLDDTDYKVFQTATKKYIITKIQCSPLTRVPIKQQYAAIERSTAVRPSAGSSDKRLGHHSNGGGSRERGSANVVGEFSGGGINNLNEEEMGTPTQEIEEPVPKKALSNKSR